MFCFNKSVHSLPSGPFSYFCTSLILIVSILVLLWPRGWLRQKVEETSSATAVAEPVFFGQRVDCPPDRVKQPRTTHILVSVPVDLVVADDGDTLSINWPDGDEETVRILGIDTAEVAHDFPKMDDQPYGPDGRGFIQGVLAMTERLELVRADCLDKYGRTLGHFLVNGRNYSPLVIEAGLALETVSDYGDNGLPEFSSEVLEAADRSAPPLLIETPSAFRKQMREKYPPL